MDDIENGSKRQSITLKEIQDLNPILRSEPFEFRSFIRKVDRLIGKWAWKFTSFLKEFHSEISEEKTSESTISECKRILLSAEGIDTVEIEDNSDNSPAEKSDNERRQEPNLKVSKDSNAAAQRDIYRGAQALANNLNCTRGGVRILNEEDDSNVEEELSVVSNMSPRKRRKKRVDFTHEERDTIQKGVAMYGIGRWLTIKDAFPEIFANREPGALEGCWKTMYKVGTENNSQHGKESIPSPNSKSRRKRVPWTSSEKAAIREGVQQFSVGEWAIIKENYCTILGTRTSVQIKDQYRTMCKRGELLD